MSYGAWSNDASGSYNGNGTWGSCPVSGSASWGWQRGQQQKPKWTCLACQAVGISAVNANGKKACWRCSARRAVLEEAPAANTLPAQQQQPQQHQVTLQQQAAPAESPSERQRLQEELKSTEAALAAIPETAVPSFQAARLPLVTRANELKKQISGLNPLTVRVTNAEAALERAKARMSAASTELTKAQAAVDQEAAQIAVLESDLADLRRAAADELSSKAAPRDCITNLRGALEEVHADLRASTHVHHADAQHIVAGMRELLDKLLLLADDASRKATSKVTSQAIVFQSPLPAPAVPSIYTQLGAVPVVPPLPGGPATMEQVPVPSSPAQAPAPAASQPFQAAANDVAGA